MIDLISPEVLELVMEFSGQWGGDNKPTLKPMIEARLGRTVTDGEIWNALLVRAERAEAEIMRSKQKKS